ncbi:MAG: bifunctional phosphoglucose/phosphomannose isomerase [Candidatus Woesearchaeota archaeon]
MKESISESLEKYSKYVLEASKLGNFKVKGKINKIVVCGVGGSGIAADIVKSYLENIKVKIPVIVNKDFELNPSADDKTLVFIISYSGNTVETLSCYEEALKKKCKIVAISSNGFLEKLCKKNKTKMIKIPQNMHPRACLQFLLIPMLNVIKNTLCLKEINFEEIAKELENSDVKSYALKLSKRINKKIPIIYSSQKIKPIILRWKQQFNENCKIPAFCNIFPELCHNEIESYELKQKNFFVIIIMDNNDNKKTNKEILAFKEVISDKVNSEIVFLKGKNFLSKLFYGFYLGDVLSLELSKLLNVDPDNVNLINKLKEKLK